MYILESGGKQGTPHRMIPMKGASIFERAREIQGLGIAVVICGAVSNAFFNLLREAEIDLICGICGDIDDVIDTYLKGTLDQPRFRMPGSDESLVKSS